MKIYAPVKDFNGIRGSVRFVNGVGETNDPALIEWFRNHGYKVPLEERVEKTAVPSTDETEEQEDDFDSMNPNELRDWAKANGLGSQIKNIRNKEKLLEIIRG